MKTTSHTQSVKSLLKKLILPLSLLVVLFSFDLNFDIKERDQIEHIAVEFLIYGLLIYVAFIGFSFYKLDQQALAEASEDINATQHKLRSVEQQNKALLDGINAVMQSAFAGWKLTVAETEVAVLIVKGFSLTEIATLRGTSERTTRDQAAAIYHKAKLKNRVELMAYFVEDLL